MSQNDDSGRWALSNSLRAEARRLEGMAEVVARFEAQIYQIHVHLDAMGVLGEFAGMPADDRVLALCRFVVQNHGQYNAGDPPRAGK
jgi:hypothetical protein